jgi:hypothetical protein
MTRPLSGWRSLFKAVLILMVLLVCLGGVIGLFVYGIIRLTQPIADAGNNFMIEIKEGDYTTAYGMGSDFWQDQLGSAEYLQVFFYDRQPQNWSFNSRNVSGNAGRLYGTVTDKDGDKTSIALSLVKEGDEWKISGIEYGAAPNP